MRCRAVKAHLTLGGFQDKDICHILIRNRVEVCLKLDKPIHAADSMSHLGVVVRMRRQRLDGTLLLLSEEFNYNPSRSLMKMLVALMFEPPPGHSDAQDPGTHARSGEISCRKPPRWLKTSGRYQGGKSEYRSGPN